MQAWTATDGEADDEDAISAEAGAAPPPAASPPRAIALVPAGQPTPSLPGLRGSLSGSLAAPQANGEQPARASAYIPISQLVVLPPSSPRAAGRDAAPGEQPGPGGGYGCDDDGDDDGGWCASNNLLLPLLAPAGAGWSPAFPGYAVEIPAGHELLLLEAAAAARPGDRSPGGPLYLVIKGRKRAAAAQRQSRRRHRISGGRSSCCGEPTQPPPQPPPPWTNGGHFILLNPAGLLGDPRGWKHRVVSRHCTHHRFFPSTAPP